jgi:hypothetical protein
LVKSSWGLAHPMSLTGLYWTVGDPCP